LQGISHTPAHATKRRHIPGAQESTTAKSGWDRNQPGLKRLIAAREVNAAAVHGTKVPFRADLNTG